MQGTEARKREVSVSVDLFNDRHHTRHHVTSRFPSPLALCAFQA